MQQHTYNPNCPNCNARLSPGATHCAECGAARVTVNTPADTPSPAPSQNPPVVQHTTTDANSPPSRRVPIINYEIPAIGAPGFIAFCVIAAILGAFALFGLFFFFLLLLSLVITLADG